MHPNIEASKYIKQILTDNKEEICSNTIIIWEFNTPFTAKIRLFNKKNKKSVGLTKQ